MARGSSKSPEKAMKKQVKMEESDEMERDEDEERMQVEVAEEGEGEVTEDYEEGEDGEDEESGLAQSATAEDGAGTTDAPVKKKRGRPLGYRPSAKKVKPKKEIVDDDMEDIASDPDDIDEEGDQKITKDGYLLGGREYRFQTFTLPRHPTRLYLYSLDACKILGFRDTYIFFLRNENVKRVNGSEEDREHLSILNLLPAAIRNRPITLVRARNLFKIFGHKVVRRGRPVRDDYVCTGLEEPAPGTYADEMGGMDDELGFGGLEHAKHPANLEGGPFRRHGISIAGFANIYHPAIPKKEVNQDLDMYIDGGQDYDFEVPSSIPKQLEEDNWMYKCAVSAASFNARLRKSRPTSFLDLHTNVEQIAKGTQPERVVVEKMVNEQKRNVILIEKDVLCNKDEYQENKSEKWVPIASSKDDIVYPLAIAKNQYQEVLPLYPFRFSEADAGDVYGALLTIKDETDVIPPGVKVREVHDLPPTLMGAIPYKPSMGITTLTTRKRGRPKKNDGGDEEIPQ